MFFEKGDSNLYSLIAPWLAHPKRMRRILERVQRRLDPERGRWSPIAR